MFLYHYSSMPYPSLTTRRRRTDYSRAELKEMQDLTKRMKWIGDYIDHISFFFDPIPSKTVVSVFDSDHPFWIKGNQVYEHVVDISQIAQGFMYDVVESPSEVEFLENTEWKPNDKAFFNKYMTDAAKRKLAQGETGRSVSGLMTQMRKYVGQTEYYFKKAPLTQNWSEDNRLKYAATVPHVMLYPSTGEIPVDAINVITLGSDLRKTVSLEHFDPVAFTQW